MILFDAGQHGVEVMRNYTASWRQGSNLIPVTRWVRKAGEPYVEISYENDRGLAMSLISFEDLPKPAPGMRYGGIRLVIDYDKEDYSHITVGMAFSDKTQMTAQLTLEKGKHEYRVTHGFRRAKSPPDWQRLIWVRLAVDSNQKGHDRHVVYRLQRIAMIEEVTKQIALPKVEFGDRVFSPRPKEIRWAQGTFAARAQAVLFLPDVASPRTKTTAEIFRQEYFEHTGRRLALERYRGSLPAQGVVLRIDPAAGSGDEATQPRPEGYRLVVEPDRVVITGADEPGLYYGGVTFFQLLKNSMRIEDGMPVPCVTVVDWPDLRRRLCRLEHPHHFKNYKLKENRGIDFLIEWTDRFVAGNKLNVLFIDLSANTIYRRRPEWNGEEKIYTLEDLERFGRFCRDRFIDLCPAWQIGGHANWWLTIGYHPELREKGWRSQGDVTHPDHDPIVYDCMLDVIEALRPKYVSPKSDEWWHNRQPGEPVEPLLHGKTRAQAFLDFHVRLNRWLGERGITMMLFHDMLTPYHNGKRFDVYKVVEDFPKDVIVLHWGVPDDIPKWFIPKGFTVWLNPTGMRFIPEGMEQWITGYGKGLYSFGDTKTIPSELRDTLNMYALFRAADHAWNLGRDERATWQGEVASGRLVAVRNLFAVLPNPAAGAAVQPLDLSRSMNRSFNDFLKQAKVDRYGSVRTPVSWKPGTAELGFIPTRLEATETNNCIVVSKGDPGVAVPVDGRYSSLIFLHTAHVRSREGFKPIMCRAWPYGFPCGRYVVHYEDGRRAVLPLRLEYNIRRFDVPSINRGTNDNRYIHTLQDAAGGEVHLFQWEWINPRPGCRIVRIDVEHDQPFDVALALLAISGRSIDPSWLGRER